MNLSLFSYFYYILKNSIIDKKYNNLGFLNFLSGKTHILFNFVKKTLSILIDYLNHIFLTP